jgi:hypothetical protein
MAAPIGVSKKDQKDHRNRKNGGSREFFATQRAERNAARGPQVWVWDNETQKVGHWTRVSN